MKREFRVEAELIRGTGGVFDVHADGKLIFSKHEHGRFPNEGEVEALLHAAGY
ncbi:Rdx family protein [Candidatus Binatia bacterium]|nr:Rdx family protein [Candidatus Binatia bacterium]